MLLDHDARGKLVAALSPQDFYREDNRKAFVALLHLWTENRVVEQVTALAELGKVLADPLVFYCEATEAGTGYFACEEWARRLRELTARRRLANASMTAFQLAHDLTAPLDDTLAAAQAAVLAASTDSGPAARLTHYSDALQEAYTDILQRRESGGGCSLLGLPTGLPELDLPLSGLQRGDLILLAGRPGEGKTSLGVNIACHLGHYLGEPVAFYTLEMAARAQAYKVLALLSGLDSTFIRQGKLDPSEVEKLGTLVEQATRDGQLWFYDKSGMTIDELSAQARLAVTQRGAKLVIVDYLQRLRAPGYDRRHEEVAAVTRGLKTIARDLQVPVLALSQLARIDKAHTRPPRLDDLAESGQQEREADVVILLHHDEETEGQLNLIIAKNRLGPTLTVTTRWHAPTQRVTGIVGWENRGS